MIKEILRKVRKIGNKEEKKKIDENLRGEREKMWKEGEDEEKVKNDGEKE